MSEWCRLNPREFSSGTPTSLRGVEVVLFLSPYDIPEAVRGRFDRAVQKFLLEFKYLGSPEVPNEPLDAMSDDEQHFVLRVGRHSHRLYRIELDIPKIGADKVGLKIMQEMDQAIDWLSHQRTRPENRGKYEVARRAISQQREKLFEDLVAT